MSVVPVLADVAFGLGTVGAVTPPIFAEPSRFEFVLEVVLPVACVAGATTLPRMFESVEPNVCRNAGAFEFFATNTEIIATMIKPDNVYSTILVTLKFIVHLTGASQYRQAFELRHSDY